MDVQPASRDAGFCFAGNDLPQGLESCRHGSFFCLPGTDFGESA
jgi:hypothetical protein